MSQTVSGGASLKKDGDPAYINQASVDLSSVYAPVAKELAQVESILKSELTSDTPYVDELLEHSRLLGGKRIRPVFLLLSAAAVGQRINESHLVMAAALEMIHTATLIHDDLLDNASTRRHRPTANARWGAKQSVLLGDYLFTHSFHLASKSGSAEALQMLAQASNRVCEGEMRQNAWQGKFELDEADYLRMITEKTAELCGVGCRLGAFLSSASAEEVEGFAGYGINLGVAFQIIDDVLDIVGTQDNVGKTLGTDLVNQKPTLPVIHALATLSGEPRTAFVQFLASPTGDAQTLNRQLLETLHQCGSIDYARNVAREHASQAIEFAQSQTKSSYSDALVALAQFVLSRTH